MPVLPGKENSAAPGRDHNVKQTFQIGELPPLISAEESRKAPSCAGKRGEIPERPAGVGTWRVSGGKGDTGMESCGRPRIQRLDGYGTGPCRTAE